MSIGIKDATQSQYSSALNQFIEHQGYLPCNSSKVLSYIKERGSLDREDRLKVSSLKVTIAAIGKWHRQHEMPDPTKTEAIKDELKHLTSLERQNYIHSDASRDLTSIEAMRVISLLCTMDQTKRQRRDRAIAATALFTGHRAGMIATLTMDHLRHLTLESEELIIDRPPFKTKTAATAVIPFTGTFFCPATWVRQYVQENNIESGYLFRGINRGDNIIQSNSPLDRSSINRPLKEMIANAEITGGKLTSHSFRKTMATIATMQGASIQEIAATGGWGSIETLNKSYVNRAVALMGGVGNALLGAFDKINNQLQILDPQQADGPLTLQKNTAFTESGDGGVSIALRGNMINLDKTEALELYRQLGVFLKKQNS